MPRFTREPTSRPSPPTGPAAGAIRRALDGVSSTPFWLDRDDRPDRRAPVRGQVRTDLLVIGGGLTGLWGALQALERDPARSVVLLEAADLGWAASGRNGGFCAASLTHGLPNGLARWPAEMATLQRLGSRNLDQIEAAISRYGIACDFRRHGDLTVAVQPWQWQELTEAFGEWSEIDPDLELLDAGQVRALVDSPTYQGAVRDRRGTALVDPALLVWGLARVVESLGGAVHERSRVLDLHEQGAQVRAETGHGTVIADRVLLATNAFPSLLHRVRPYLVPVWDHALMTEPLSAEQRRAIGWTGGEGIGDAGNQFHYYRMTDDDRILWGGYDALYYFGGDMAHRRSRSEQTEVVLAQHFFETFPQLEGLRFSHAWGGAIDTCTRFTAFWQQAFGGKICAVQGFTGLGVGASRFAAGAALDLLDGIDSEATELEMVRQRPVPFPPEPFRWVGIQLTRASISRADSREGRRNLWLRALDAAGLGFDS